MIRRRFNEAEELGFPIRAVALGVFAMVLIALASTATAWLVGQRIRDIGGNQITVITQAERLQRHSDFLQLYARIAVASGDAEFQQLYGTEEAALRKDLDQLKGAIRLAENRVTFDRLERTQRALSEIEYQAMEMAVAGRRPAARALLAGNDYLQLTRNYRNSADDIADRSRAYVAATRDETRRYLSINLGTSVMALLLIALAWVILVRPARSWGLQLAEERARAESAAHVKGDFLAMMSHEIRTPLNSIIGFSDLLRDDPELTESQRHKVDLVQSAGMMLLTVVNDVLDFSKFEAGRIELLPEPFAVETLVDNSVSIVRDSAEAKGLELRVTVDPKMARYHLGDEGRLRQILLNLLNNGIKFTAAGLVSLAVRKEAEVGEAERLLFSVTDTGTGIAENRQQSLFEPFSQGDASITRTYGGTGLGLSISKRLVELMDGEIGVMSTEGQGSYFWFRITLPRAARLEPAAEGGAETAGYAGARILIAEDLPMNRELAGAILARAGHEVDMAEDGEQALEKARSGDYDIILMDIQMPKMDGLSATRAIRALAGARGQVPIVALTANALPDQVREFMRAGMNGHVAKPIRQPDLHKAIRAALAEQGAAPAAAAAAAPAPAFDETAFAEVREMLAADRLREHLERLDRDLEALIAGGLDTEAARAMVHKLISQTGMIGFTHFSRVAADTEGAIDGEGTAAALAGLRRAARPVRERLAGLIAELGS